MSEMVRNQGIVRKLSTPETTADVYKQIIMNGHNPSFDDIDSETGVPSYIDSEKYMVVRGCIFDVSGSPTEYDTSEEVNEAVKLNDTDYRIHAYYYNGGGGLGEMLDESIPRADEEYVAQYDSKSILREAINHTTIDEPEAIKLIQQIYEEKK